MSNRLYDILKWIAQILLPALGALYFGLADLWDLPKAVEIVGTITIVDTFLGAILGIAKARYDKSDDRFEGVANINYDAGGLNGVMLNMRVHPEDLSDGTPVTFQVKKNYIEE